MQPDLDTYAEELCRQARLGPSCREELTDHLHCAFEDALERGHSRSEALTQARKQLGAIHTLAPEFHKLSPMNLSQRLLGLAVVGLSLLFLCLQGNLVDPLTFLSLKALLLVVGLVLGGLLMGFGPAALLRTMRQAFERQPLPGRDTTLALQVAERGRRLAWFAGVVGTLWSAILVLENLESLQYLGHGLAVSLLSLLYGALLAEVGFASLAQWLRPVEA